MHTGIISFADRIAYNIKSNDIKNIILNDLYNLYKIRIIQKNYHKLDDNNINFIKKLPYLICLRTNGNPYYLYLTTYNDIPIIYFIDKKVHPNYEKPRIILARGLFDKSLFKNTLLDGEMVKDNDGKWIFIINDIICYEGKYLDDKIFLDRLKIIYHLLNEKYTPDPICDVCIYKIKKYYYPSKETINNLIDLSKQLNYTCRGIYFWSYNFKHKPILYNFNEDIIINVFRKSKDTTEFLITNKIEEIPIINEIKNEIIIKELNDNEKILWITKTDDPDVYNLYDNEFVVKSEKIGIAFVPNLQMSKLMRLAFKEKNTLYSIKFKCKYNNNFNKYEPIEMI